ncbi:MAG TPA: DUF1223 domain-containing protein [Usitatibacter sp.]|jgi:hypothetical protein|nr:DUF1223 domain-containing protein [Usitatibacter sp.]
MNRPSSIAFVVLTLAAAPAQALQCKAASGTDRHALVELYTSEGCSSCPPAERWLSRFGSGRTDSRVVPVEFHVDYWDHDGWKDPFSDARYTRRQEQLQKATGARFVYTPQVVVSGRDVPDWRSGVSVPFNVFRSRMGTAKAKIAIDATVAEDASIHGTVDAALEAGTTTKDLTLVVVAVQNGLASRVTAGENRGEQLAHDFVARDMASTALAHSSSHVAFDFKPGARWAAPNMSVAAFVQDAKTGEVLQAVTTGACR